MTRWLGDYAGLYIGCLLIVDHDVMDNVTNSYACIRLMSIDMVQWVTQLRLQSWSKSNDDNLRSTAHNKHVKKAFFSSLFFNLEVHQ